MVNPNVITTPLDECGTETTTSKSLESLLDEEDEAASGALYGPENQTNGIMRNVVL